MKIHQRSMQNAVYSIPPIDRQRKMMQSMSGDENDPGSPNGTYVWFMDMHACTNGNHFLNLSTKMN